jgi:hypothetical protein
VRVRLSLAHIGPHTLFIGSQLMRLTISKPQVNGKSVSILLSLMGSLSFFGCNLIYDFERTQCEVDSDCTARGGEFESMRCTDGYCESFCQEDEDCGDDESCIESECVDRWACFEEKPVSSSSMFDLSVAFRDIGGVALPDVSVNLCSNFDPNCETPREKLKTDEDGRLEFKVESSFAGFLETKEPGYFPQMDFLPENLSGDTELPAINLSPAANITGLALATGGAVDDERGHVLLTMRSCAGAAPGVRMSARRSDAESLSFYINGGFPAADLDATTEDGAGGFLNFQPGNATLDLETEAGRSIAQLGLSVRKGTLSVLTLNPTANAVSNASEE